MKPLTGLYKPIPFLIKYPLLHEIYFLDLDQKLKLRYVSLMQDVAVIYTWINKPRLLSSGHIKTYQRYMLKYYKSILESFDSQCFMVLENDIQVCQIEVLPAIMDTLHAKWAKGQNDVTLRYVADFRIPAILFRNCIFISLDYIFRFSEHSMVFISLPSSAHITGNDLEAIGCMYVDTHYEAEEMLQVYCCHKDSLKTK